MRHAALTWLAFMAMTIGLAISVSPISAIADTNPKPLRIVAFGDSLVAGYGLRPGEAFPDRLQKALAKKGLAVTVLNSGVSGDTTSGGLARFDWAVPTDVDAVILELGANDMLRGLP
ncbi:MAG: GDSL-type esterase/lipase family protein, partial [Pseudomonadota bacterium]